MRAQKVKTVTVAIVLWLLSLVVLVPLLLIVINSLKTPAETNVLRLTIPKTWEFENFARVFKETNIVRSFFNSLLVTCVSIGLSVFLGTMAGYVLSRNRDHGNKVFFWYFLAGMVMPIQMIALVQVLQKIHMMDSYVGLILVYAAMFIPQTVFMVYGFVQEVPKDMDEAAIMDGANPWNLFIKVILPLLKPIIVTLFITQFVFVWNDFQLPLYLIQSSKNWTIVLGVYNYLGQYNSQWNMVCAYIMLCTLPVIIVYLIGQKYIIEGMVAGAIKG